MSTSRSAEGSVVISIDVNRPARETWRALTEKDRLEMWFGTPSGSLTTGSQVRIDFGDGDFFTVEPRTAKTAELVEFDWQFLGMGPVSHVRWEISSTARGSTVTVRDTSENREPETVRELTEGWTDFLGRLGRYLDTGRSTRYETRAEIDGAIDLPPNADGLLAEPTIGTWLPVTADGLGVRTFTIAGPGEPRRFEVRDWRSDEAGLHFDVRIPGAATPTSATVRTRRLPDGIRLSFQHAGWAELGLDTDRVHELRTGFAAAWISALDDAAKAAGLAETGTR